MDQLKEFSKKTPAIKSNITKMSPNSEKSSPLSEDLDDDIAIVGENVKENPLTRKKKFAFKRKSAPVIQIQDESSSDEFANVCGFNVHIKSLLQNEDIRKQLEPFIEMETINENSSDSEIEEIVLTVNKKQPLHEQIQKKLLQYERNEKELVSNISVQTSAANFNKRVFKPNVIKRVQILNITDPSGDENISKKRRLELFNQKINARKNLVTKTLLKPEKNNTSNGRSLPRISHIQKYNAPFKLSILKRQEEEPGSEPVPELEQQPEPEPEPEQKEEYMKNLNLEPLHESSQIENNIVLDDLINMDLSSDAKILSMVDKLCDTENESCNSIVIDNVNSASDPNLSILESSDLYYLNISNKKEESKEEIISSLNKTEKEFLSKDRTIKFEKRNTSPNKKIKSPRSKISSPRKNNRSESRILSFEDKLAAANETTALENVAISMNHISPTKSVSSASPAKSVKNILPAKSDSDSNNPDDSQVLRITDDILPVETVAPKRRGRKRKRGKKRVTYGKIGLQEKLSKKSSKNEVLTMQKPKLALIQDTLSETIKSFYSTDQLPPIKQEIQETDERTTVEDSNENLNMDTGSEEQEVVHLAPTESGIVDANNLLSVYRKESVQEFYKSKDQQMKKRKKRKRVTRMKYQNLDRSQWTFLKRRKRGEEPSERRLVIGECKKCGRKYEKIGCLKMHEMRCSGEIVKRGRQCALCNFKAKNRAEFKTHLVTHIIGAPSSPQNMSSLHQNGILDQTISGLNSKMSTRKIGKKKLRFMNLKRMEIQRRGLRSSDIQSSVIQTNPSTGSENSQLPYTQLDETVVPKRQYKIRRGRRVYYKPRRYLTASVTESASGESPVARKMFKIRHRINRYYQYSQANPSPPRGILSQCMAYCQNCDSNTWAERRKLYCEQCNCTLTYWCGMCKKQFFAFTAVRYHLIKGLQEPIEADMKCPKCYRSHFSTRCSLRRHKRTCNAPFRLNKKCIVRLERCELQPELFKGQSGSYHVHCQNCDITKVIFKEQTNCSDCQSLLQYVCEICDKLEASNSDLRNHVLNVHIVGVDSYDPNDQTVESDDNLTDEDDQMENLEAENSSTASAESRSDLDEISDEDFKISKMNSVEKDLCDRTLNLSLTESLSLADNDTAVNVDQSLKSKENDQQTLENNDDDDDDDDDTKGDELPIELELSSLDILEIIGANITHAPTDSENPRECEESVQNVNESNSTEPLGKPASEQNALEKSDDLSEKSSDEDKVKSFSDDVLKSSSIESNHVKTSGKKNSTNLITPFLSDNSNSSFFDDEQLTIAATVDNLLESDLGMEKNISNSIEPSNSFLDTDNKSVSVKMDDRLMKNTELCGITRTSTEFLGVADKYSDYVKSKGKILSVEKVKVSNDTAIENDVNPVSHTLPLKDNTKLSHIVKNKISRKAKPKKLPLKKQKPRKKRGKKFGNRKIGLQKKIVNKNLKSKDDQLGTNKQPKKKEIGQIADKVEEFSVISSPEAKKKEIGQIADKVEEFSVISSPEASNLEKGDEFSECEGNSNVLNINTDQMKPSLNEEIKNSSNKNELKNELSQFSMQLSDDSSTEDEQPLISLTVDSLIKKMDESPEVFDENSQAVESSTMDFSKNFVLKNDEYRKSQDFALKINGDSTKNYKKTDTGMIFYDSESENLLENNRATSEKFESSDFSSHEQVKTISFNNY